jgi:hypothetical protein
MGMTTIALIHRHHRRVDTWENSRVSRLRVLAPQVAELGHRLGDFVGRDALALGRSLRRLRGQRALGVGQALALREQLLLNPRRLVRVEIIDDEL